MHPNDIMDFDTEQIMHDSALLYKLQCLQGFPALGKAITVHKQVTITSFVFLISPISWYWVTYLCLNSAELMNYLSQLFLSVKAYGVCMTNKIIHSCL